ncbi:TonB-dependent receptor [Aliiglaciecola sp. M165]|uniref:TonB-dependent receptor n=1 Tax=Aliiglaciecola sp. M165 TaxID=2593649 RepID=UPI0011803A5A|nr:TonB-dependent receptor [Aliiglaciecola sp. M165]TRY29827.1 TonB-dependent receptor [Aliiglaciecola sp. M165]
MKKLNLSKIAKSVKFACVLGSGLGLASMPTQTVFAQESADNNVEKIEVRGIRASSKENLNQKRFASAVVDVITAEDIGKFPDKNVADTLARVPGVTVSRDFGEGEGVTIRGFSPEQNTTLLNGQAVGTAQWFILRNTGRNFNFEMLASEMVAGVEVYKSPQADIEEGGLGGTVIVHTRKPLDMDSGTIAGSIEAEYSDISESWDPAVSGMYSWKNDEETLGFVVSASLRDRQVERHSQESDFGWFGPGIARIEPGLSAPSTQGVGNPGPEKGSLPWGVGSAVFEQDRSRKGFDATLQYAPNDKLDMSLHFLHAELEASNVNSNLIGIPFRGLFVGDANAREGTVSNGFVNSLNYFGLPDQEGWVPQFLAYDVIYRDGSSMQTQVLDFELNYAMENGRVHFQAGTTTGDGQINDFFTEFWADPRDPRAGIIFSNPNPTAHGASIDFTGANPWLSNPTDEMWLAVVFDQQNTTEDKENYAQLDVSFDVEYGAINEIKVGAKIKDRSFSQFRIRDDLGNTSLFGEGSLGPASDFWTGELLNAEHGGNSLPSMQYFFPNQGLIRDAFAALPSCSAGGTGPCRNDDVVQNIANFEVDETLTALYAMANFSGDGYRGNFGVRYVSDDRTTHGFDGDTPVTFEDDSLSEFLPSINLVFDLSEDLVLRTSAAKVLTRPSPFNLAPSFNLTPETGRGQAGNPNLQPMTANQFDLGVEWYFDEASIVSLTWFRKDISQFFFTNTVQEEINGVVFNQLQRPENGGNSNYEGIEFQVLHDFDNGFGASFNYTYVDASDGEVQSAELIPAQVDAQGNETAPASAALVTRNVMFPDVSQTSFNVGGYYENDLFSARLNYTWRDEYFISNPGLTEFGPTFRDDYGQWDAQFSYNVTENITLKVEAINITDEIFNNYLVQAGNNPHPADGTQVVSTEGQNGRRFFVGANFRF